MPSQFKSYHPHLDLSVGEDLQYTSAETVAAWRTWQSCKLAVMTLARTAESNHLDAGNVLKATITATLRKRLSSAL